MLINNFRRFALVAAPIVLCASLAIAQEETKKQDGPAEAAAEKQDEAKDSISEAIQAGEWDEAAKLVSQAAAAGKDVADYRSQLIAGLARARQTEPAYEQSVLLFNEQIAAMDKPVNQRQASMTLMQMASFARGSHDEQVMAAADELIRKLEGNIDDSKYSPAMESLVLAIQVKARLVGSEDGIQMFQNRLDKVDALMEMDPDNVDVVMLRAGIMTQMMALGPEAGSAESFDKLDSFLAEQFAKHSDHALLATRLVNNRLGRISRIARDEPEAAAKLLEETEAIVAQAVEENPDMANSMSRYERSFTQMKVTIESAEKMAKMIGQPAPALDPEFWANSEGFDAGSLQGKVVLLDFWAVWCGPCIATFPHLKDWQESYGHDGLQIVGVTRAYNYEWDADASRAVRSDGEVAIDDELVMINKFMESHELKHPSMVTPKGSTMNSDFGVTGIPHAVLIDRNGLVRLIKVGSGEANAKAIEEMIKQLLAE